MARLDLATIKKIDKERNTVHAAVTTTYTVFDSDDGDHYVQIDTYGRSNRVIPEKISQSFQLDRKSAEFLVELLRKEFSLGW